MESSPENSTFQGSKFGSSVTTTNNSAKRNHLERKNASECTSTNRLPSTRSGQSVVQKFLVTKTYIKYLLIEIK